MHAFNLEQPEDKHDQIKVLKEKNYAEHDVSNLTCSQNRVTEMEAIFPLRKVLEKETQISLLKSISVPQTTAGRKKRKG